MTIDLYKSGTKIASGDGEVDITDLIQGQFVPKGTYQYGKTVDGVSSDLTDLNQFATTNPLPIVDLSGDFDTMTKDVSNVASFRLVTPDGRTITEGFSDTKWQGASSTGYEKKNYGLKLYTDNQKSEKLKLSAHDGWFKTNKLVLKANYVDATHARNIVAARLWKEIMQLDSTKSHLGSDAEYKKLAENGQYGTIDGFPVQVRVNGKEQGLYTLNLDNNYQLFNLDDSVDTKAILMYAKNWGNATMFWSSDVKLDGSPGDFKVESPDKVTDATVATVKNFIANTGVVDDSGFKSQWGNLYNPYNLIDYALFINYLNANDNASNNIGYFTESGKVFYVVPYDLDGTFDMSSSGRWVNDHTGWWVGNTLLQRAAKDYRDILASRYDELKTTVLNKAHIMNMFTDFKNSVGSYGYDLDKQVWPDIPSREFSTYDQIEKALDDADSFMASQVANNWPMKENVDGIKVDKATVTGAVGGKATVQATLTPADSITVPITWSTDNDKVATVDGGVITFVGVGSAKITASAVGNNGTGVRTNTASTDVTVTETVSDVKPTADNTNDDIKAWLTAHGDTNFNSNTTKADLLAEVEKVNVN